MTNTIVKESSRMVYETIPAYTVAKQALYGALRKAYGLVSGETTIPTREGYLDVDGAIEQLRADQGLGMSELRGRSPSRVIALATIIDSQITPQRSNPGQVTDFIRELARRVNRVSFPCLERDVQ